MYTPSGFVEKYSRVIHQVIENNPLATVVINGDAGLLVNHLPLMLENESVLIGHIAANNEMVNLDGVDVTVVFTGEDAYVSPNWYPSKKEHHKLVPTWNYQVVHIRGRLSIQRDDKSKLAAVGKLTKWQEEKANGSKAWKMSDAPQEFMSQMLGNIAAMSITIDSVEAKSKLSQNRESGDYENLKKIMAESGKRFIYD
jgi:transcriptional regulator